MKQTVLTFILVALVAFQSAQDAVARFNRAVELQQQGKLDEAAAEYRAALALKPDYPEAQANLGVALARLGKYDEAIAAYEAALQLAPQLTPIRLNLGIAHYRAGQHAKAAEALKRFLEQRPDSVQARQLYGLSLVELGRDEEAIIQFELTLDAAPPDAAALYSLGLAYLRLGKPGFRATLERLASFPAGRPALHLLQGQAFLRDLEFDQALEELQAAAKLNPDLPRLHFSLGLAHLKLGQTRKPSRPSRQRANAARRISRRFITWPRRWKKPARPTQRAHGWKRRSNSIRNRPKPTACWARFSSNRARRPRR